MRWLRALPNSVVLEVHVYIMFRPHPPHGKSSFHCVVTPVSAIVRKPVARANCKGPAFRKQ